MKKLQESKKTSQNAVNNKKESQVRNASRRGKSLLVTQKIDQLETALTGMSTSSTKPRHQRPMVMSGDGNRVLEKKREIIRKNQRKPEKDGKRSIDCSTKPKTKASSHCVQNSSEPRDKETTGVTKNIKLSDEEIVNKVWDEVMQQCEEFGVNNTCSDGVSVGSIVKPLSHDWQSVRVFVSSTFSDFHNEREVLIKQVFPELKEWCSCRKIQLVECDLRWGVPKDTATGDVILTCLEEIDRCLTDTDNQPFFICMLGERYGWIPSDQEVPDEVQQRYQWIHDVSITFMEILHGALRSHSPNAIFLLRDPSCLQGIPDKLQPKFCDMDNLPVLHLQELKTRLGEMLPEEQIIRYSCEFAGVENVNGKDVVKFTGLQYFHDEMIKFFKRVISNKYGDISTQSIDDMSKELYLHDEFLKQKCELVIGRDEELSTMLSYCTGRGSARDSNPLLLVTGPPGYGKSALLAKFINTLLQSSSADVFFHFATVNNAVENVLLRLCHFLRERCGGAAAAACSEEDEDGASSKPDTLHHLIHDVCLPKLSSSTSHHNTDTHTESESNTDTHTDTAPIVIVIDGINELSDANSTEHLSWLPTELPASSRLTLVVSCTESSRASMARLEERAHVNINCQQLSPADCTDVVTGFFAKYNKRLDVEQLSLVVSNRGSPVPLWLMLCCEELRIFGEFSKLTQLIRSLPDTVTELLTHIINRLLRDDPTRGGVHKVLCMLGCSQPGPGISEGSMPALLAAGGRGEGEVEGEVSMLYWAQCRRLLKPFLRENKDMLNTISFVHHTVQQAVERELLGDEGSVVHYHTLLCDYYTRVSETPARGGGGLAPDRALYHLARAQIPYHLKHSRQHAKLVQYFSNPLTAGAVSKWMRHKYMVELRCKQTALPTQPLTSKAMLCHQCSAPGLPLHNSCVCCGNTLTGMSQFDKPAYLCARHAGGPGAAAASHGRVPRPCVRCARPCLTTPRAAQLAPQHAMLCHHCGLGRYSWNCAKLVINS